MDEGSVTGMEELPMMAGGPTVTTERRFERDPEETAHEDLREAIWELGREGEWIVQPVPEPYYEATTKYGLKKKIPLQKTWHHKSCGQCGHIPGYSTSIFWLNRLLGYDYFDPRDQTSCTAWNYYASATSNQAAQAAVAMRNFAAAYETGYYPLIHCGTSFGHYKEVRHELVHDHKLRRQVKGIMDKLGRPFVMPEEMVHYSEWMYAIRGELKNRLKLDVSNVTATVHPACHYYKLQTGDAIYDPEIYGGQRTAAVTAVVQELGAKVADYSSWYDCCGFGFRHILVQRDFTRSFATLRKIEVMKEEANPDVVLTHDTGCVTSLDKSQFAAKAHNRNVGVPVMAESQFAALALGAHPFRVVQLHWHSTEYRALLEKMGIDVDRAWAEFQGDLKQIEDGTMDFLRWEHVL